MPRTPGVQWVRRNPIEIALNPWSWAYGTMMLQLYYGGKIADATGCVARSILGDQAAAQASNTARRLIMASVRVRSR